MNTGLRLMFLQANILRPKLLGRRICICTISIPRFGMASFLVHLLHMLTRIQDPRA